jgi:hypothetical protein
LKGYVGGGFTKVELMNESMLKALKIVIISIIFYNEFFGNI